ncbi:glutamine synthetase [Salpingoeca rosetta]|uniref:Glutamine synthetase n=1 Tax=Salpingoeca rosetta (strain ATCC 50818 / BSB-021) TaxID=946362 RepID=F2UR67_SALR5|nr:glutamine synthetase [Salpingoeca rosetta]EGD80122.1 glutamine synthetase [Salpingoeca rosetta]|eukprot:XP_004988447.1 glutamine synthetase [Salpingoeca rosetta]
MSVSSGSLNPVLNREFDELDQQGRICAEYIWIGGTGRDLRSKTKVIDKMPESPDDLPEWNFDGSSTGQAPGHDSEVLLKPESIFRDPFRRGDNILVLCSTWRPKDDGSTVPLVVEEDLTKVAGVSGNNTREAAKEIFEHPKVKEQEMWFGIEQEYTLFERDGVTPLGWPKGGFPRPQGPYYCSNGAENSFGRDIADCHLRACMYAGVKVSGTNGEVMPGQWEYQVGPCEGIESGDHLTLSRYLMYRVCEKFSIVVSFEPKPMAGDWNGAGCHTNFSTKDMRDPATVHEYTPKDGPYKGEKLTGAWAKMIEALEKMGSKSAEHLALYGADNHLRLTGKHETADMHTWSYGVANRGASVRIPRETHKKKYGYLEDRRPASNMDPYVVTSLLAKTILLDE